MLYKSNRNIFVVVFTPEVFIHIAYPLQLLITLFYWVNFSPKGDSLVLLKLTLPDVAILCI